MCLPGAAERGPSFPPLGVFEQAYGFVPALFRAQSLFPRAVESEAALTACLLVRDHALSRVRKESILLAVAAARRNVYCVTAHYQNAYVLGVPEKQLDQIVADHRQAGLTEADTALLDFAVRLGAAGGSVSREDVSALSAVGWNDEAILETVLMAAWANFLCTLAAGLGVQPDFEPTGFSAATLSPMAGAGIPAPPSPDPGPYIRAVERNPDEFPPFGLLRGKLGFVPNIFRAQTLRPDVVEAEAGAFLTVLFPDGALTRRQKECIQLAVSTASRGSYWPALHSRNLLTLGVSGEEADQIAGDHRKAPLGDTDKALLGAAVKLAVDPAGFGPEDLDSLRHQGLTDEQALEAVVTASFARFFHTLQAGLGAEPDFEPRQAPSTVPSKKVHLPGTELRPTSSSPVSDPDAELVARVQGGDLDAFEGLMNRHNRRVYRTLVGILGSPDEARDAMQDTFLKAFQHLGEFQGRAKFSTWLMSIASNTGLQLLRERRPTQSLDDDVPDSGEGFRPKELRAWADDPEQSYSKEEVRSLIEDTVRKLPAKYRVVMVLRDIEQLSVEEAAAALGLGIPALKARLLRARLMVREALAPRFSLGVKGGVA